ncbi:MAG: nucleotidyltransferase domain-containing protein [Mucilaginibacter sp.]
METGLSKRDVDTIVNIFRRYPEINLVHLFGSRAIGNYKNGSDIDLAIMNSGVKETIIKKIKSELEESSIPYFVDLINYPALEHQPLRTHIDEFGVVFYK